MSQDRINEGCVGCGEPCTKTIDFYDLEKAYDKIPKKNSWVLEKKKVSTKYINLIKDMYTNVMISIKACDGESNVFSIKIRLH
jgi:uncharacterized membrane protein